LKYGLYGVVLAAVVGGTVAWTQVDKTVTVQVDGAAVQKVRTDASTVAGVLQDAKLQVGPHDIVAPAPADHVHGGSQIVLRRGRLLDLDIDGLHRQVWTTAPTVAAAMAQLGYATTDFTSVSRAKRLPLSPTSIEVRTPKTVTVVVDGQTHIVDTTDPTVAALLHQLDVKVNSGDRMSVRSTAALSDGLQIVIRRVTHKTLTSSKAVPFATTTANDPTLPVGQTSVVSPGKAGITRLIYSAVYIDGKLAGKTLVKKVIVAAPQTRVVKHGTKKPPPVVVTTTPVAPPSTGASSGAVGATAPSTGTAPTPSTAPTSNAPVPTPTGTDPASAQIIGRQMAAARGWGDDQFECLFQMWGRESGWRVDAANGSGAYGIPQALPGSKMAVYGADWQTNPATQIAWGLAYIGGRYGTPCNAWNTWQSQGWY
jgi:uncharacterized protein YabE (DUF348 family)